MCLVLFAYNTLPGISLLCLANRDEFWERPTKALEEWESGVLGGRDLESGGTWLGAKGSNRISFITNVRNFHLPKKSNPISRGLLVSSFLDTEVDAKIWWSKVNQDSYEGFNLFLFEEGKAYLASNATKTFESLEPGIFTVSNGDWKKPWPKMERLQVKFEALLGKDATRILPEEIQAWEKRFFLLLQDKERIQEESLLPDTGIGLEKEKILSSIRIQSPGYGTRSSAVLTLWENNTMTFTEKTYLSPFSEDGTEKTFLRAIR